MSAIRKVMHRVFQDEADSEEVNYQRIARRDSTMALTRWDPFREAMTLRQAMDRLFEESYIPEMAFGSQGMMPMDVYEENDSIVVEAHLSGFKPEDVDVTVENNVVTIAGEKEETEEEHPDRTYHLREWQTHSFTRSFTLPVDVNPEACDASFEDGILRLRLPKTQQARRRQVPITAGRQRAIDGESREAATDRERQHQGESGKSSSSRGEKKGS
jgi:HSP20 family protein